MPGRPQGVPNRHQPKTLSQDSVGARVVEGMGGGPLWSPVVLWPGSIPLPAGDHKGPPHHPPSTLAPTNHPAPCVAIRLRLKPIGRPQGRPIVNFSLLSRACPCPGGARQYRQFRFMLRLHSWFQKGQWQRVRLCPPFFRVKHRLLRGCHPLYVRSYRSRLRRFDLLAFVSPIRLPQEFPA